MTELSVEEMKANLATLEHIEQIRNLLAYFASELIKRGKSHDRSKLGLYERGTFAKYGAMLRTLTYGSPEYEQCRAEMAPALKHHYACNRHHPEYFEEGINGMNLIDLLEMYIDWQASTMRHNDGNIFDSIEVGKKRFGMSSQLAKIFENTAHDLCDNQMGDNSTKPEKHVHRAGERTKLLKELEDWEEGPSKRFA